MLTLLLTEVASFRVICPRNLRNIFGFRALTRNCFNSRWNYEYVGIVLPLFFSFFFISSLELTRRRRSVRFAAHLLLKLISIHHCPGHKGSDRGINPLRSKNIFLEGQPVIKIRNSLSYCIDLMLEDKIVTIIKSMKWSLRIFERINAKQRCNERISTRRSSPKMIGVNFNRIFTYFFDE